MGRVHFWMRKIVMASLALAMSTALHAQTSQTKNAPTKKTTSTSTRSRQSSVGTNSSKTRQTSARKRRSRRTSGNWRRRGQQKIDPERARQIQEALIREHYLQGEPSGIWDAATQKAMERYQTDNGWQNKNIPDSRALIKMGLGPGQEHLLNPESAMTTQPGTRPISGAPPSPANPSDSPPSSPTAPQN